MGENRGMLLRWVLPFDGAQHVMQRFIFCIIVVNFCYCGYVNSTLLSMVTVYTLYMCLIFDSIATTSIADQSNVQGAGSYEGAGTGSAITPEQNKTFSAVIDESTKAELLAGALALRQLVRIKLSDEADLQQGLRAGTDTHTFLKEVRRAAMKEGISTYAYLQRL
jgi:hypothetical protein